jgi:hypothetical protein
VVLLYASHVVFAVFFGRNVFPAAFLETDVIIIAGNIFIADNAFRSAYMIYAVKRFNCPWQLV